MSTPTGDYCVFIGNNTHISMKISAFDFINVVIRNSLKVT